MESDIIEHLVGVEHKAATFLDDAVKEAQHRLDAAKFTSDKQYKTEYEKLVVTLESKYATKTTTLVENHSKSIKMYKEKINNEKLDETGFQNLLDKLIFEA